jgi:pyrophosphatase PpaX
MKMSLISQELYRMKLRGIIFDLDGTLADTMEVCVQAFDETLLYYTGRGIRLDELFPLFGPSEEGILRRLLPDQAVEAYSRFLSSYDRAHGICTRPFPGIEGLLDDLRSRQILVGIATGKSVETAQISLRKLGLASRVEQLETGFIDRGDKPELIRRMLAGWQIAPDQAAYVGDVPSDLHAAERAGVLPIGAAWAASSPLRTTELQDGWLVFQHVEDLAAWVHSTDV